MPDVLRIKRRPVGGAAGPPATLAAAEIAYNEQDDKLYYGKGNSGGNATSILPIAGPGGFLPLTGLTVLSGAENDYKQAQFTLSGGGTISWGVVAGRLKWTARFICIPTVQATMASGDIEIPQPTTNIPAGQVFNGVARTADANGVALGAWEALYAVHTPGGNSGAYSMYIVYFGTAFSAPSNWILIGAVNGDDNTIKLGTGLTLPSGGSFAAGVNPGYAPAVVVSDTAPGSPRVGQLWYDSVNARMFMWYSDANSSQWVQF